MNPSIIRNTRLPHFFVCAVWNYKMANVSVNKFRKKFWLRRHEKIFEFWILWPIKFSNSEPSWYRKNPTSDWNWSIIRHWYAFSLSFNFICCFCSSITWICSPTVWACLSIDCFCSCKIWLFCSNCFRMSLMLFVSLLKLISVLVCWTNFNQNFDWISNYAANCIYQLFCSFQLLHLPTVIKVISTVFIYFYPKVIFTYLFFTLP